MSGEVYLDRDVRGWHVIHESRFGDSSGIEGPFVSRADAVAAAKDMAARLGALFTETTAKVLAFPIEGGRGQ